MIFLPPFLFCAGFGFLILTDILKRTKVPHRTLLILTLSTPVGFGMCSILLFWSYLVFPKEGKLIALFLCYLTAVLRLLSILRQNDFYPDARLQIKKLFERRPFVPSVTPRHIPVAKILSMLLTLGLLGILTYFFFRYLNLFLSSVVWNAYGGWDARFIWHIKAKFYFRAPEVWAAMFSPLMDWTHPDYPLLLPGAIAWGWNWVGKEILIWPHMVNLVFSLSTVFLVLWYLGSYTTWKQALVAGSFLLSIEYFLYWGLALYADVPLCFMITAATLMLIAGLKHREADLFFLSGFIAGFAAWTKNEGYLFAVWLLATCVITLLMFRELSFPDRKRFCLKFLGGLALPIFTYFFQKWFLSWRGDYWDARSPSEIVSLLLNGALTAQIAALYFRYMFVLTSWNSLWVFFCAALLYRIILSRGKNPYHFGWVMAVVVALLNLGYFLILHISPHNVLWQIGTSLDRLLLHSSVLAIVFTVETFSLDRIIGRTAVHPGTD